MNWNSHSVDAVSKERIWREHVLTEKNTARIHEEFRCNPLKKDPPTAESISKRPARFLDRTAVIMDMLQKRLERSKKHKKAQQQMSGSAANDDDVDDDGSTDYSYSNPTSGRSQIQQSYQLKTRGMYSFNDSNSKFNNSNTAAASSSSSARGMNAKDKLPPLTNTNNSSKNNGSTSTPLSPRTKKVLAVHDFDGLYSQAQLTPREKFAVPQTAMQEIGWWNQNLISNNEQEPRFRYGLGSCDVTKNGSAFVGSRKK